MSEDANWKEVLDHERWLREMCEDYRLPHDPHKVSMRCAINGLIHSQRAEIERLQAALESQHASTDHLWNAYHALEANALKLTTRETLSYVATQTR